MLLDHGQEGLEPVHKLLKSPQSGWRSIFLLFDAQVDETLDPLAYDAGSQTLTKPLLFMDGCQIFVVEESLGGVSYAIMMMISPVINLQ